MPPEEQASASPEGDGGFKVAPGQHVGNIAGQKDRDEFNDALRKAIEEVGEITEEDNEAAAAAMAEGRPIPTGKTAAEPSKKETEKAAAESKPETDPELGPDGKPKENSYAHERTRLRKIYEKKEQDLHAQFRERDQKFAEHVKRHNDDVAKYAPLLEAIEAYERGDSDDFATHLHKFTGDDSVKTWADLVNEMTKRQLNPYHREHRKMRMDLRARDERERRAAEEARANQQREREQETQRGHAAKEREWQDNITEEINGNDDPGLSGVLEIDPNIASWVFATQKRHHEAEGVVLPTAEATTQTLQGLWKTVEKWRAWAEAHPDSPFVQKITGHQAPTKKPETKTEKKGTASPNGESGTTDRNGVRKGNAKAPPAVSQNRTAEASAVGRLSDKEILRRHAAMMDEENARERSQRLAGGSP